MAGSVPEAMVISLNETKAGLLNHSVIKNVTKHALDVNAVLIGPGMDSSPSGAVALHRVVQELSRTMAADPLILDAEAIRVK